MGCHLNKKTKWDSRLLNADILNFRFSFNNNNKMMTQLLRQRSRSKQSRFRGSRLQLKSASELCGERVQFILWCKSICMPSSRAESESVSRMARYLSLNTGFKIPVLGFGTYMLKGEILSFSCGGQWMVDDCSLMSSIILYRPRWLILRPWQCRPDHRKYLTKYGPQTPNLTKPPPHPTPKSQQQGTCNLKQ